MTVEPDSPDGGSFVRGGATSLALGDVLGLLRHDATFTDAFLSEIREAPFDALFWETPAPTGSTRGCPVQMPPRRRARAGSRRARPRTLGGSPARRRAERHRRLPDPGRGGEFVVPAPLGRHGASRHLAAFVRAAPAAQSRALLERTAAPSRMGASARAVADV